MTERDRELFLSKILLLLEVSMPASHAVSLANQILHDHFKLTNITIIRGDNIKSTSFFV